MSDNTALVLVLLVCAAAMTTIVIGVLLIVGRTVVNIVSIKNGTPPSPPPQPETMKAAGLNAQKVFRP